MTPNQQSLTPIFGLGLNLQGKFNKITYLGLLVLSKSVIGTLVLKILV